MVTYRLTDMPTTNCTASTTSVAAVRRRRTPSRRSVSLTMAAIMSQGPGAVRQRPGMQRGGSAGTGTPAGTGAGRAITHCHRHLFLIRYIIRSKKRDLREAGDHVPRHPPPATSGSENVDPGDLAEAREVAVRRAHLEAMLDSQGRQVCVGYEVAPQTRGGDQAAQHRRVVGRGLGDPGVVAGQPLLDVGPGLRGGHRPV